MYLGCFAETTGHTAIQYNFPADPNLQFGDCVIEMYQQSCQIFKMVVEDYGSYLQKRCFAARTLDTYDMHGPSTECQPIWPPNQVVANDVYMLKGNLSGTSCLDYLG